MSILVLLPSDPVHYSNGFNAYLSIIDHLYLIPGTLFTSAESDQAPDAGLFYSSRLPGSYIPENSILDSTWLLESIDYLILPDHIDGLFTKIYDILRCSNRAIGFINLVFAPLYAFEDPAIRPWQTMYDERDYFIFFNRHFSPTPVQDIYLEPSYSDLFAFMAGATLPHDNKRKSVVIYAGKGHFALNGREAKSVQEVLEYSLKTGKDFELVTRTSPSCRNEYFEKLIAASFLIVLDPFTNLVRDALLCGTPVFCPIPGIDYRTYGMASNSESLALLLDLRKEIALQALERHKSMASGNVKRMLRLIVGIKMLITSGRLYQNLLIPYSVHLAEMQYSFSSKLRNYSVVGELSSHTHRIDQVDHAIQILMDDPRSDINHQYRAVASNQLQYSYE